MNIVCPQCGFCRDVNPNRFTKDSVIAICPKCACKFRFYFKNGEKTILLSNKFEQNNADEPEDIRLVAKRAYEREAQRFKHDEETDEHIIQEETERYSSINPWEGAPGESGWITSFYQTVIRVMFSAPVFFGNLKTVEKQGRPLSFYLVICIFQIIMERMWGGVFHALFSPMAAGDPQMEKILVLLAPDNNIALSILIKTGLLIMQLYLFSFLMYLVYRLIVPKKASFNLLFQILAYSSAPYILCIIPVLGSIAGLFWGLGCLAVGCKSALNLNWPQTFVGFIPLILFFAPLLPELLTIINQ